MGVAWAGAVKSSKTREIIIVMGVAWEGAVKSS